MPALQIDALWNGLRDNNGKAYSGAIVCTYAAGTSTPKVIWQDREQTLPTTAGLSQFTLDSNGRYKAFGDGRYKIALFAPTDTGLVSPIYEIDGVTYTELSATYSATPETGKGALWEGMPYVDVRLYGIGLSTTNGTDDWTLAVNNALAVSKNLVFPEGTFLLNSGAMEIPTGVGGHIRGAGVNLTTIKGAGGTQNVIEIGGATTRLKMSQMTIDGNGTTGTGLIATSTPPAIGRDSGNFIFEQLYIANAATICQLVTCSEVQFNQVEFSNLGTVLDGTGTGLLSYGSNGLNIELIGGGIAGCDIGIDNTFNSLNAESEITLRGVSFAQNTSYDVYTTFTSRWNVFKAYTEGSGRFMYITDTGSGSNGLFNFDGLVVHNIAEVDQYAVYAINPVTFNLKGCRFENNEQIFTDDNRTIFNIVGSKFGNAAPVAAPSGTQINIDGTVLNGVATSPQKAAYAYPSAATLSLANGVQTTVDLDTVVFDKGGLYDAVEDRFTIPAGGDGLYRLTYAGSFDTNAAGDRSIRILQNGSIVSITIAKSGAGATICEASTIVNAVAGDYFECVFLQSSGGALNINGGNRYNTRGMIERI